MNCCFIKYNTSSWHRKEKKELITETPPYPSSSPPLPRFCCRWKEAGTCCTSHALQSIHSQVPSQWLLVSAAQRERQRANFLHCQRKASLEDFCAPFLPMRALGRRTRKQCSFHGLVYEIMLCPENPPHPTSSKFRHFPLPPLSTEGRSLPV